MRSLVLSEGILLVQLFGLRRSYLSWPFWKEVESNVTARGDTSLWTRRQSCLQAWYGREVRCTGLLQLSSSSSWIESTEIRIPRTRRLILESFDDSKTTFYTTLPFRNLMSFQRHLFAQDRLRPHYSGPFYLWRSACLPPPSSYVTQTTYLYATSSPWPYLCHTVTWSSPMSHTRGQVLTEHVVRRGRWQV